MAMIQGIDGSVLLNALRAGRQDRMIHDEQQAKIESERRAAERQERIGGLMGQLFGRQEQGVAAQVVPQESPMDAATRGEMPLAAAPPPPVAEPPRREVNREVLTQLIALDPEVGGKIVSALKTLDETALKASEAKNSMLGAAAQFLSQHPVEQRAALMRNLIPQMAEAGWTLEEINGANLSDEGLQGYIAVSMDTDTLIDNELAEREFQAGKTVPVTAGGNVALVKPDGSARYIIGGAGDGSSADAPRVGTPEDYNALAPGTEYIDPEGNRRRKPGGGGGNATGGF